jgi:hypothetical protein
VIVTVALDSAYFTALMTRIISCEEVNRYGLSVLGPNDVIAGFGLPLPKAGVPLWLGGNTYHRKRSRDAAIELGREAKRLTAQSMVPRTGSVGTGEAKALEEPIQSKNTRKCRNCGEEVSLERIICSKCQMPA